MDILTRTVINETAAQGRAQLMRIGPEGLKLGQTKCKTAVDYVPCSIDTLVIMTFIGVE